jgi:electron transport complex protein RnfD
MISKVAPLVSYPPYIHDWRTSARAVWICVLTLLPIVIWSSIIYGHTAVAVWGVALASSLISEAIASGLLKRWTLGDGSAVLTGLLVAATMPPGVPLYIPAVSVAFAILIVKTAFGGLGSNWMNPALGGIAFAYANWPVAMREYVLPRLVSGVDGVSASTPLLFAKGLTGGLDVRVMDALRGSSYPLSDIDSTITGFMNDYVFSRLGARLPDGYIDLAIGLKPGTLGESALLAVLVGSIVLMGLRLIKPLIPLAMLTVFTVLVRILGTGLPGESLLGGDALFALSSGGIMFAAFYMASDPVSSPLGRLNSLVYGAATGSLAFIFRRWGTYSEGVVYAILVMNVLTPYIEKSTLSMIKARGRVHSA